jgi:hypothetical protein
MIGAVWHRRAENPVRAPLDGYFVTALKIADLPATRSISKAGGLSDKGRKNLTPA